VESPGEDPLLNGLYGSAYLEGLQGDDPHTVQAVVTLKHWFAYNLESYHGTTRHNFDAKVTAFDLQSTYVVVRFLSSTTAPRSDNAYTRGT
jgi:beta-glucosidase-like glycosyl hydrolase